MSAASGQSTEDLASSLLGPKGGSGLEACFAPQNVAVIGATEKPGSVGRTLLRNLISSPFGGTVFPVNPNRPSVLGIKAYPNDRGGARPGGPRGDRHAGADGARRDRRVRRRRGAGRRSSSRPGSRRSGRRGGAGAAGRSEQARRGRMRVIGPNCLGVMQPADGLNATFAARHGAAGQRRRSSARAARSARRSSTGACGSTSGSARSSRSARCSTSAGAT